MQPQKDFLDLGLTFYLFNGFHHVQKQTEIEILYENILKLQEQNQVKIKLQLRNLLKAEAIKNRSNNKHSIPPFKPDNSKMLHNNNINFRTSLQK